MFANTLLECAPNLQNRRRWTVLLSLTLQATAVSLALIYPLLHPERLPFISTVPKLAFSAPTIVRVVPAGNYEARPAPMSQLQWRQQLTVRHTRDSGSVRTESNTLSPEDPFVRIGPVGNSSAIQNLFSSTRLVVRPATPPATKPVRLSRLDEGRLLQKVQPVYPPLAKQLGVEGDVILTALIARDGTIEGLKAISGHSLLIRAAKDAVSQWRYKPYLLNGSAVEVETTITVTFRLEK